VPESISSVSGRTKRKFVPAQTKYVRTPREARPDLMVAGKVWTPRVKLSREFLVSEQSIYRLGLATLFVAGVIHHCRDELVSALMNNSLRRISGRKSNI
jgi:hypothetical protein